MGEIKLKRNNLEDFFEKFQKKTGITFKSTKIPFLENRLRKRIEYYHLKNLDEYLSILLENEKEFEACLPLLTTHKTEWFREIIHFQWIQENLFKNKKNIRIWSAACSSGEEVYSLLFLAIKNNLRPSEINILGTDLSPVILKVAKELANNQAFKTQLGFLEKKIKRKISEKEILVYLQESVDFKNYNLLSTTLSVVPVYDLIIVRNVFIYFDFDSIDFAVSNLLKSLKKGGYLIIGLSETINYQKFNLTNLGNSIFRYDG